MRSTRATAAVARLNERCGGGYQLVLTGAGLFRLRPPPGADAASVAMAAMELDDFVTYVNSLGPQKVRRVTKNDAAFSRQLGKKPDE